MAKLIFLSAALLATGFEGLTSAIAADPKSAAGDILLVIAENEDLQKGFDALKLEHEALAKINVELQEAITNTDTAAPTEEAPVIKLSDKTFTVDKTKYKFCYPAILLDGVKITNEDVLGDKELQKKLVDMGSGFIEAI